jgi:hypothetical protein
MRPSSDPVCDVLNDASHLTVGPTFQGNPLKSLLARKKTLNTFSINTDNNIEKRGILKKSSTLTTTTTTATVDTAGGNHQQNKHSKEETSKMKHLQTENRELREEIEKWKNDHSRKMEERKKYFEPQVLKIDDDYEPTAPPSDDDNEDLMFNEYDECHNPIDQENAKSSSRVKSAFKNSFEKGYAVNSNENVVGSSGRLKSTSERRRIDQEAAAAVNILTSSVSLSDTFDRESSASSSTRVRTSDTGYESSLSNLSLSSKLSSNPINLKVLGGSQNGSVGTVTTKHHQPIIASSASSTIHLNTLKPSPLAGGSSQNLTSLRQLKNNLKPLPGIKMPK